MRRCVLGRVGWLRGEESAGRRAVHRPELRPAHVGPVPGHRRAVPRPELRPARVGPVPDRRLTIYMRRCVLDRVGWLRVEDECATD
jgi:hypothetical protein